MIKPGELVPETFARSEPVANQCIEGKPRKPSWKNPLGLPAPLTGRQVFYIGFLQCIGAAAIDGAINFGIACAMYRSQSNITMWQLSHNTIAGDMGVTVLIQGTLTFVIASSMVHVDMRKGTVAAFPYPWPDQSFAVVQLRNGDPEKATTKRGRVWRTCHQTHGLGRGLHFFSGSASNDLLNFNISRRDWFQRLFWTVWKGFVLSVLYFLVVWPIAIACVAPKWGGLNMAHTWTPQIIKLVFAFMLGLLMNPVVACIALGSEDAVRSHRREVKKGLVDSIEEAGPAANTAAHSIQSYGLFSVFTDDVGGSRSRSIDKQLEQDRRMREKTVSIFLAGTGESGKSTVVKQLRLKYSDPYTDAERDEYRSVILSNLVQSMVVILDAMSDFNLELRGAEQEGWYHTVNAVPSIVDHLSPAEVLAIYGLWNTPDVKGCLQHSSKFQLNDSAAYFFNNLERITSPTFLPNDEDILRARVRTTGIIEAKFQVKDKIYKVLDVGGQRSERRKWIACFENVDVLLFLFAVSEFDQQLYEDETQNRFVEAENLFGSISNSLWFKKGTLIIFFNKIDLFAAKMQTTNLASYLEDFPGPNTTEAGLDYIRRRILSLYHSTKPAYTHFTQATDTKGINVILSAVQDQINTNMLKDAYML